MFSKDEFEELGYICDKLVKNNSKINKISNEIMRDENDEIKRLKKESEKILLKLDKKTLYNIVAILSIGRLGIDSTYGKKFEEVKSLANDKYYIREKLIEISDGYLERYFNKGLNYVEKNLVK